MSAGLSRRAFLASGTLLAGVGWAGALASRAVAVPVLVTRKKLAMRRSAFAPLVGQTFRMTHGHGSLTVVLRQVGDLDPSVHPGLEDQFSLIFTGRRLRPTLSQGTYTISHPWRGRISLFVVPVSRSKTAQDYQAIINNRPRPRFL